MKYFTRFLTATALLWLMASCHSFLSTEKTVVPLAIHTTKFYHAQMLCNDTLSDSLRIDISSLAIDTVPPGLLTDSLTAFINYASLLKTDGTLAPDESSLAASLLSENREVYSDPDFHCQGWTLTRKVECLLNADGLFSVSGFDFSFMGGAHPNTQIILKTFDLTTGLAVTVKEMVAPEKMPQLLKVVEQKFRKVYELADTASWQNNGFWFDDGFKLPQNMAVTPDGLYLIYNQYEVAPYAVGTTELIVDADEWMNVLTPEWQQRFGRVRR